MKSSTAQPLTADDELEVPPDLLGRALSRLGLPPRLVEAARRGDLFTLGDLLRCSPRELKCLPQVGPLTLWDTQEALRTLGVSLAVEVREPRRYQAWRVTPVVPALEV